MSKNDGGPAFLQPKESAIVCPKCGSKDLVLHCDYPFLCACGYNLMTEGLDKVMGGAEDEAFNKKV